MANGPPRGSMSQERVFYVKEWTKEIDGVFIHALTQQTMEGNIVFNGIPNRASLLYCKALVNDQFGKSFDYDFFVDRFNKLYKHFSVFNWIIKEPGVIHYPLDHSIDCDDAAWSAIYRYDALGLAYMRKGEAEFDNLQYIFTAGHESENEADEHQVIENSSDPDDITPPTDEAYEGQNNAFSYELAWYTSPTRSTASGSIYSSLSGASSNMKKSVGKKHSSKRPPVPRLPSGLGPSSVASSSPFKKGVHYNQGLNKITFDQHIYGEIIKDDRLALAYAYKGEPEYDNLRRLFAEENDSVGFNLLQPIEHIATDLGSLSVTSSLEEQLSTGSNNNSFIF